jgi:uncharacterized protein
MNPITAPAQTEPNISCWNGGDSFRSRWLDAFSVMLPGGEHFLNEAVKTWLEAERCNPGVPEALKQEAMRFMREEATHRRAHGLYNARMAQNAPQVMAHLTLRIDTFVGEMNCWRLPTRLAFAAGFEQLTTFFCQEMLRSGNCWLDPVQSTPQKRLWLWHAREEVAHHRVLADILSAAGVGNTRRMIAFAACALYLTWDWGVCFFSLCAHDIKTKQVSVSRLLFQAARFAVLGGPSLFRVFGRACVHWLVPARH